MTKTNYTVIYHNDKISNRTFTCGKLVVDGHGSIIAFNKSAVDPKDQTVIFSSHVTACSVIATKELTKSN